jgi:urease accessory protein
MKKPVLTAALALMAGPALAHTGHGAAEGFLHGLAHPIFGPDHLLAMLAVGLWSGFVLPTRFWAGAATFLAAMAAGAGLSWAGVPIPGVETLIVGSVIVFGLLVLLARPGQGRAATLASLAAIAVFAACHGHAHATEATGAVALYLTGFLTSTAALHLAGIGLARSVADGSAARRVQQGLGALIAASGLVMLVG